MPHLVRFHKPTVVITARVHPGEIQGSQVINGVLKTLLNPYFQNIPLSNLFQEK
jgi:hypothetical protein